ncbi:DNA cytosine methyltransferase [Tissierella praeacuta]|uniref:DNA cytosine methyltransferase n=1 Tax=Tissierella praeacuta TaxID=43131 RepID=UPI002FD8C37A
MSKTACLGILRRARARGKELPKQLKIALEIQGEAEGAEEDPDDNMITEYKAYHINQRNEGIDLNGISGALMATQNMQMQTFVTEPMICLNDQGGDRMDITENITSTLRASMGGNQPIVMATQQGGAEICVDLCPTITSAAGTSGNNQPVLFDNHAKDCRYNGPLNVAPTISATYGTGGNNVPLVSKQIDSDSYCIAGNTIDRQDHNGGNGCGFQENISYTLTTSDIHAVCYPPKAYQNTVGALYVGDEKGNGNQYVSQDKCIVDCEKMMFGQSEFANYKEGCATLRAEGGDNGGGSENLVATRNLVRRLTPLECERLQGFPNGWTKIEKSSDSARYKALGNSVAIPCVNFIMQGIAYFMRKFKEEVEE